MSRHICGAAECSLFDHLVGAHQERFRYRQSKRLCGLKIDNKLKLRRVLHRQVNRLGTSQYAVNIARPSLKLAYRIEAIRHQSARFGIKSQRTERRQAEARGQCDDEVAISKCHSVRTDDEAAIALGRERRQGALDVVWVMYTEFHQLDLECRGPGFSKFEEVNTGGRLGMHHVPNAFDLGQHLL